MDALGEFWSRLEDVEAGILGLLADTARLPVAPCQRDDPDGNIWFITTHARKMAAALTLAPQSAQFVLADGKSGLYGSLTGLLSLSDDQQVVDELWNPAAMSWIAKTPQDTAIRLLCFTPQIGTIWYSSTKGLTVLYAFQDGAA